MLEIVILRVRYRGIPGDTMVKNLPANARDTGSWQVSRGSAGEYQADERAGVARISCRVSGR